MRLTQESSSIDGEIFTAKAPVFLPTLQFDGVIMTEPYIQFLEA
jgi:hypothetical protein